LKILDQATEWVRNDALAIPIPRSPNKGSMLLERARLIGLFY